MVIFYRSRAGDDSVSCQTLLLFQLNIWSDKLSIRSKVLNKRDQGENCSHHPLVNWLRRARMRDRQGWALVFTEPPGRLLAAPCIKHYRWKVNRRDSKKKSRFSLCPCSLFSPLSLSNTIFLRFCFLNLFRRKHLLYIRTLSSPVHGEAFSQYVELQVDSRFSSHVKDRR